VFPQYTCTAVHLYPSLNKHKGDKNNKTVHIHGANIQNSQLPPSKYNNKEKKRRTFIMKATDMLALLTKATHMKGTVRISTIVAHCVNYT
jgi:hypothetical protein